MIGLTSSFKNLDSTIRLLALTFPILLISVKILGNLILIIFTLVGIYRIISEKINPIKNENLRLFTFLTLGYFFIMALSIILNTGFDEELKHLFRKLHFLLAPLIAVALYKNSTINIKHLLNSLKGAIVLISTIIFFEFFYTDHAFPSGMINSNILGDLLVIYLLLSLIRIFKEPPKELSFTFLTFFTGTIAVFLTGSRGSILTLAILFFIFLISGYRKFFLSSKNRKSAIIFFLLLAMILGSSLPYMKNTYDKTISNISTWQSNHSALSSSGIRLQIWSASIEAHKNAPWYGYGYRSENKEVAKYSNEHKREIASLTHLHNEYLTHLLSAGYIGLIALLMILFVPLYLFIKNRKKDQSNLYAVAGILLCLSYFLFGFTHIAFGEEHINAFYIFMLAFLLPNTILLNRTIEN